MAPILNGHSNGVSNGNGAAAYNDDRFTVKSPNVIYTDSEIKSTYTYHTSKVEKQADGTYVVEPLTTVYDFKTERKVPKVGLMLVGWGGNNGTTVTAGIIANRKGLTWQTREGTQEANYYGSVIMGSTVKLGNDASGKEINIPFHEMLPMVHPNDLVLGGWDISSMNMADAMDRAAVLEPDLKRQVRDEMREMVPLPSVFYPDFIAANQGDRADNVLGGSKQDHVETIRKNIR